MTGLTPYVKIHNTEITAYLRDGYPRPIQPSKKIKDESIAGTNKAVLWSEGQGALGYRVECRLLPSQYATYDTIAAAFNFDDEERLFYPRADRYAVCSYGQCDPLEPDPAMEGPQLRLEGSVWCEVAELYSATPSSWDPTDEELPITQAVGETNGGNLDAPLYSLTLTSRGNGPALEFNGSSSYITCGAVDLSGYTAVSFEMWVLVDATGVNPILTHGAAYDSDGHFVINLTNGRLYMQSRASGSNVASPSFGAVSAGWHHILITIDITGNAVIAYVDGAKLGYTWTRDPALAALTNSTLYIGRLTTYYSTKTFARFRSWGRVLSAAEAEDAYLGEAVSGTNLLIDYDFLEGSGGTLYDLSGNGTDGTLTGFGDTTAGYGDSHTGGWITSMGPVSPALELLSGAVVVESLALASSLMASEVLELDRSGTKLTQTYTDDYAVVAGGIRLEGGGIFSRDGFAYAKYRGSDLVLTSLINGRRGELITITITDTDQASTTVSVSGWDITVDLETSGGSPVATVAEVRDAINQDDDAKLLVLASLASGEDGSSIVAPLGQTALSLNVTVTGGALVIEDGYEAGYHLGGTRPIVAGGLVVTFTPTASGSGVFALEASIDSGATWETVIDSDSDDWTDTEEMVVTIPYRIAGGQTEVWIRWACPASATSLSIADLTISQERDVSDSEVPIIPAGSTYYVQLDGLVGWGGLSTEFRNRYLP